MRASKLLIPTLKETPADAEVISHQLLVRAGMVKKLAQGIYSYLPLGWRVMKKISDIVRDEMDRSGCQEVMLPIIQPAELWEESGRWQVYGRELMRFQDRHDKDYCLGPTHEEVITDLVRRDVSSYKQLPMNIYQIQNKYRDERRPRFGLIRGREFLMKDGYSFDRDEEGLDVSYREMYDAYKRVFSRCGLESRAVEADSGAIGGTNTHEFMVIADTGEAEIVYCSDCDYSANTERAVARTEPASTEEMLPVEKVHTPDCKTIEEVCGFLGSVPERSIKALLYRVIYEDREEHVAAFVRGDRNGNEIKIQNALGALAVEMDTDPGVLESLGIHPGFVGPKGLTGIRMLVDEELTRLRNLVCGANEPDHHLKNVNFGRDWQGDLVADIRQVQAGEGCPRCQGTLSSARGIEVGQVFKLGTKYSESMGAMYLDENGKSRPMVMGCYGIGVSRTMAACVEQNHDDFGIIWPPAIAPFEVCVVTANQKDETQRTLAEQVYGSLQEAGLDVLLDDTAERAGVKFANADLIGYPVRITVGKMAAEGKVEIKVRRTGQMQVSELPGLAETIRALLKTL